MQVSGVSAILCVAR